MCLAVDTMLVNNTSIALAISIGEGLSGSSGGSILSGREGFAIESCAKRNFVFLQINYVEVKTANAISHLALDQHPRSNEEVASRGGLTFHSDDTVISPNLNISLVGTRRGRSLNALDKLFERMHSFVQCRIRHRGSRHVGRRLVIIGAVRGR